MISPGCLTAGRLSLAGRGEQLRGGAEDGEVPVAGVEVKLRAWYRLGVPPLWPAFQPRDNAKEAARADPAGTDPQVVAKLTEEINDLAAKADKADEALIEAIRDELHPSPRRSRWRPKLRRLHSPEAPQITGNSRNPKRAKRTLPKTRNSADRRRDKSGRPYW